MGVASVRNQYKSGMKTGRNQSPVAFKLGAATASFQPTVPKLKHSFLWGFIFSELARHLDIIIT